jgi:hypothetical protein
VFHLFFIFNNFFDLFNDTGEGPLCERGSHTLVPDFGRSFYLVKTVCEFFEVHDCGAGKCCEGSLSEIAVRFILGPGCNLLKIFGSDLLDGFVNNLLGGLNLGILLDDDKFGSLVIVGNFHISQ